MWVTQPILKKFHAKRRPGCVIVTSKNTHQKVDIFLVRLQRVRHSRTMDSALTLSLNITCPIVLTFGGVMHH